MSFMRSQFTIFNDHDTCTKVEKLIQDWFHESCCNLRERPSSRENTPAAAIEPSALSNGQDVDDAASEASSSGLPSPLISEDEYESFVCGACVSRNPTLRRWAGSYGFIMVVRDSVTDSWRILNGDSTDSEELVQAENGHTSASSGVKRPLSPSALEEPDAKRVKGLSNTAPLQIKPCLAPSQGSLARKIVDGLSDSISSLGTGDIFCTFNFRERWCHCDTVGVVPRAIPVTTYNAVFSVIHLFRQIGFFSKKKKHMNLPTIPIQVCCIPE